MTQKIISEASELASLPVGSVVRPLDDHVGERVHSRYGGGWASTGYVGFSDPSLPAEVLHNASRRNAVEDPGDIRDLADLIEHLQTRWEADRDQYIDPLAEFTARGILAAGYHSDVSKPQGEPTDVQVSAAIADFFRGNSIGAAEFGSVFVQRMREAIRAAGDERGAYIEQLESTIAMYRRSLTREWAIEGGEPMAEEAEARDQAHQHPDRILLSRYVTEWKPEG